VSIEQAGRLVAAFRTQARWPGPGQAERVRRHHPPAHSRVGGPLPQGLPWESVVGAGPDHLRSLESPAREDK
jgi:hypothetical protein